MNIIILSTADWHSDVWTNKQHIALRLSENGHSVVYIESLGLRKPAISIRDWKRIASRLRRRRHTDAHRASSGITIVSPKVIPWHGNPVARMLNRFLLRRSVRALLAADSVFYSFSPVTYGLESLASKAIYHSVDLLHELPRMPARYMLRYEQELIRRCSVVAASSPATVAHLVEQGAEQVRLWPNVADIELFSTGWPDTRQDRIVFAGNLTPTKICIDWLEGLVECGFALDIAGPVAIDGTDSIRIRQLVQSRRVTFHGTLCQEALSRIMQTAKVGVIPYQVNRYTRGVFPMKVFEYISAGLLVVSSGLPALLQDNVRGVSFVDGRDEFVESCRRALVEWSSADASARAAEVSHRSWEARISEIEDVLS